MTIQVHFEYPKKGAGRPQILLIGNGLEIKSGQDSWEEFVGNLSHSDRKQLLDDQSLKTLPFPLRYELLSAPENISMPMKDNDMKTEERRLAEALRNMENQSNSLLEKLPELRMDHIFTTNYSYCLEKAFFPERNFMNGCTRSKFRFYLINDKDKTCKKREVQYRLHTGYCYREGEGQNTPPQGTGLWHIHGECSIPSGVVLGHDRYGRLLARIVQCCQDMAKRTAKTKNDEIPFFSWPELFLFGDIYILGFGFYECEFDLWWLLRRKQRERNADGQVYFYAKPPYDIHTELRHSLLEANGVKIRNAGAKEETDYDTFYEAALLDIKKTVEQHRSGHISKMIL